MGVAARVALGVVMALYPFIVYSALHHDFKEGLIALVLIIMGLRLTLIRRQQVWLLRAANWATGLAGILLVSLVVATQKDQFFLAYPVLVNLVFFAVFAASLRWPPTVIERFARLQDPNLPASGVRYTRKVTIVWCVFFIANALISVLTISMGLAAWTLYNGLISYLLIGVLLGGEWVFRQWMLRSN